MSVAKARAGGADRSDVADDSRPRRPLGTAPWRDPGYVAGGVRPWIGLVVLGLLAAVAWIALVRRDVHGGIGTRIRYDDFDFTVLSVGVHDSIGEVRPQGVFRVVRLQVANAAQRVDYDTASHRAVLIDAAAGRHEVDPVGQQAWDARTPPSLPPVLHAGESAVAELVFDVPAEASVELAISWGGPWIDALDWLLMGERRIALH